MPIYNSVQQLVLAKFLWKNVLFYLNGKKNQKLLVNIFLVYVHDFLFSQLGEWVW